MKDKIVIIALHNNNSVDPVTYESISLAWELCKGNVSLLQIVILGNQIENLAKQIASKTGVNVTAINNSYLELYNSELYIENLLNLFNSFTPNYIIIPHTYIGYDFAPALAVRLNASCITAIERINIDHEKISFTRAMFNWKLYADIIPDAHTTVITTQPGAWRPKGKLKNSDGTVEVINKDIPPKHIKSIALKQSDVKQTALTNSNIIISAGRGIGKKENLSLIYDLLQIFPKAGIGCSRPVCDAGWLDYTHQIGITGTTVSPKLYIAVGISGAVQHISGIRDATIIAINNDPYARIFKVADYCIVEDLTVFIPILVQEYKKRF